VTLYFHPDRLSGGAETRTRVLGAQHPSTRYGSLNLVMTGDQSWQNPFC
jgi:hypothetical protein